MGSMRKEEKQNQGLESISAQPTYLFLESARPQRIVGIMRLEHREKVVI